MDILLSLIAITGLMSCRSALQPIAKTGNPIWIGQPPAELEVIERGFFTFEPTADIRAFITFDLPGKQIVINWEFTIDHWDNVESVADQRIPTAYWPTEIQLVAGTSNMLVAGKSRYGATRIELWHLGIPQILPRPDLQTGETKWTIVPPDLQSIDELYSEKTVGRDMVMALLPNMNDLPRTSVFVYFWDSRDVYRLDLLSGAYEMAASSTVNHDVTSQEKLNFPFNDFWSGTHKVHGYVYVFTRFASSTTRTVVLRDVDRDGQIDDSLVLNDNAAWEAAGFGAESRQWGDPQN